MQTCQKVTSWDIWAETCSFSQTREFSWSTQWVMWSLSSPSLAKEPQKLTSLRTKAKYIAFLLAETPSQFTCSTKKSALLSYLSSPTSQTNLNQSTPSRLKLSTAPKANSSLSFPKLLLMKPKMRCKLQPMKSSLILRRLSLVVTRLCHILLTQTEHQNSLSFTLMRPLQMHRLTVQKISVVRDQFYPKSAQNRQKMTIWSLFRAKVTTLSTTTTFQMDLKLYRLSRMQNLPKSAKLCAQENLNKISIKNLPRFNLQ